MLPHNHLDRIRIAFDDHRLVANAGLVLPATPARRLGLPELVHNHLDLGRAPGRANTGDKMMTLVASALVGGDCIDAADVLRTRGTARALGSTVSAPSTLGAFLRSFRWGHVRQLDRVSRELLAQAWKTGGGRWRIENCSLLPPNHVQHLHAIWWRVVIGCRFSVRKSMQFVLRVLATEFGGHRSYQSVKDVVISGSTLIPELGTSILEDVIGQGFVIAQDIFALAYTFQCCLFMPDSALDTQQSETNLGMDFPYGRTISSAGVVEHIIDFTRR